MFIVEFSISLKRKKRYKIINKRIVIIASLVLKRSLNAFFGVYSISTVNTVAETNSVLHGHFQSSSARNETSTLIHLVLSGLARRLYPSDQNSVIITGSDQY